MSDHKAQTKPQQHTPGPWYTGNGACHQVFAKRGRFQAHLATAYDTENSRSDFQNLEQKVSSEEAFANATLIAAAPDMLEALRQISDHAKVHTMSAEALLAAVGDLARAAIAKATGGVR